MARILLVAGDPSGDLYGSMLMRALRARRPGLDLDAAGGPLMRTATQHGDSFYYDLASHGVTGFIAPLLKLPTFIRLLDRIRTGLREGRVDAVVCIDFYGFNRHVLSAAKRAGVPALYFISPQVWATRPGRVRHIKNCVDRMMVIFPFEEELYKKAGVPVDWVGHPLLDVLPAANHTSPAKGFRLGILPGSRSSEVRRHLPVFLGAAQRILRDYPDTTVSVFAAPQLQDDLYNRWLGSWRTPSGLRAGLVREGDYAQRSRQDFILTSSGTATLENALLGIPMVVIYKMAWPTYLIARSIANVKMFAMVNILSGKIIVPELLQGGATAKTVSRAALDLIGHPDRLKDLRKRLLALRSRLGGPGAVDRTARRVLEALPA